VIICVHLWFFNGMSSVEVQGWTATAPSRRGPAAPVQRHALGPSRRSAGSRTGEGDDQQQGFHREN
jgi:hypothetical protein